MNIEDVDIGEAEREASPNRYAEYDPRGNFRRQYSRLHPDQRQALSRTITETGGSSASSSQSSASSIQLQEIRTNNQASAQPRHPLSRTTTQTEKINKLERHPTALDRIETHRSQHANTIGSLKYQVTAQSNPLPNFGAGKPYPPPLPDREEYVVEFDSHGDALHPQNWPMKKKLYTGAILAYTSLAATMGSSIFSPASSVVAVMYGVSTEVGVLGTSLFVLGYAFGPIIWAPYSELYGRKQPIMIAAFGFGLFSIAVATAENLQTILIGRFFAGLFGSCPLAVVAAVFADIFNNEARGLAIAIFASTVFVGPLLAPFIGGFITESYLGWRWTMYIAAIMGFSSLVLVILFVDESYPPKVLVSKASELRRRTKNWGIHAKQEEVEVDFRELITKNVSRPMRILFTEPIVLAVSIYMAFVYGLLYLFLTAYALVFQQVYGFSAGVGGLPYFGMVTGELIGFAVFVAQNPSYVRKLRANNNVPVPEWRIPLSIAGAILFTGGLFWFGWTGYQGTIPWIVPTLSGLFTGFGIFTIFLQLLNYIIDAYLMFAASALAGNTFLRSLCGCIFPLFANYMFAGLGINYTLTLLGALAAVMIPVPIIFLLYGKRIRMRSKFAPAYDIQEEKRAKDEETGSSSEGSNGGAGHGEGDTGVQGGGAANEARGEKEQKAE